MNKLGFSSNLICIKNSRTLVGFGFKGQKLVTLLSENKVHLKSFKNPSPTLMTLLRIPYLGRIGSTKLVLPIRQNMVFLIESSEYSILRSHFASLKMHPMHAHRKSLPKWVPHAHRNLLPHIAPPQVAAAHCKSCFGKYVNNKSWCPFFIIFK